MKLAQYLSENSLSDDAFGKLVERHRTRVMRWRKEREFPDAGSLRAIFAATKGQVTANDFFHAAVAEGSAA